MKMLKSKFKLRLTAAVLCACLVISALFWSSPSALKAQNPPKTPDAKDPGDGATNKVSTPAPAADAGGTNAPPAAGDVAAKPAKPAGDAAAKPDQPPATDEINLSFENAQINDVLQWLAEKTGKSIIKKQDVQGQVSIMNAKKLKLRDAVNLIYRALALDGFTAIESATTIIVVREGQEPKMSPEVLPIAKDTIPEGRQKLVKIFPLKHIPPAELRDKVRLVLSDKGTIDVDERGNQIIVTDYNDNLRMMVDLVKQFDVASVSDVTLEIYSIKHADAEEVGNLVGLIVNAQPQPPGGGASSRPSPARPSNGMPSLPPGMVMPGNDSPPPSPGGGGGGGGGGYRGGQRSRY